MYFIRLIDEVRGSTIYFAKYTTRDGVTYTDELSSAGFFMNPASARAVVYKLNALAKKEVFEYFYEPDIPFLSVIDELRVF